MAEKDVKGAAARAKAGSGAFGRRRRKEAPEETARRYGQPLTFIPSKDKRSVVAYIDKGLRRRVTNWKKRGRTKDRPTPNPKRLIPMFIMIRQVRLKKRLNVARDFQIIKAMWSTEIRAAGSAATRM